MMYLDLDELPKLFSGMRFWSYESKNWACFKRADYYGRLGYSAKRGGCQFSHCQATGYAPRGAITMLTNMRYFGHCFNPVTFYYCFEQDGQTLQAIVNHNAIHHGVKIMPMCMILNQKKLSKKSSRAI